MNLVEGFYTISPPLPLCFLIGWWGAQKHPLKSLLLWHSPAVPRFWDNLGTAGNIWKRWFCKSFQQQKHHFRWLSDITFKTQPILILSLCPKARSALHFFPTLISQHTLKEDGHRRKTRGPSKLKKINYTLPQWANRFLRKYPIA